MSESGPLSDGNAEPHREERDETRTALLEAVEEHETDEIPGGAQVGAVLTTANENLEYRLTFVFETLLQLMAEGALYESADGQLRPTDPQLVTDGGVDQSADGTDRHPHKPTPIQLREIRGDLVIQEHKPGMWRDGKKEVVEAKDRPLYHLLMEVIDEADAHCPDLMPAAFAQCCRDLLHVKWKLENVDRGRVWIPDYAQYGMSYCHNVRDAIEEWRAEREPLRFVIVGCSSSKNDVDGTVPIRELYRGSYWSVKRDYGETIGDQWRVLSAKHGLVDPSTPVEHYDRHIAELEHVPVHADETDRLPDGRHVETLLDSWAVDVYNDLRRWLIYAGQHGSVDPRDVELDVLLGRDYRDALADRGVWDRLRARGALDISFPFQEVEAAAGGNGNQMGWMTDEIEGATAVATDGGEARVE